MKRVFVLGAAGFIGRHLCAFFSTRGIEVIAATRRPASFDSALIENAVASFDAVDQFMPLLARCDAVIHAASSSTPGSSEARPQLEGNLRPTLALIEALQALPDRRLLYLSSAGTLYGDCVQPATESAPLRPRSYHGAGKAAAEHFMHAWTAQYGGTGVVIRPSNVYGPGQPRRADFGIIPAAFDCALHGRALTIWGDGTSLRDYLYVDDLVALCGVAIAHDLPRGLSVFNASAGHGTTLNALLDEIDRITGHPLRREYRAARRVDVRAIVPDNTAARDRFAWHPAVSLAEGLGRAWAWYRANQ
ncbi:NAD-dependent epimerase/dehydratase family protein [Fontimonas sp. SYSU GA230001]|uniref:NAD-dependent epimerase/dehydratase family protein n=1 Tax=Fontimonas sp. SYSU GA230001 TaxID=3142450 RepID=UPI0032B5E6C3